MSNLSKSTKIWNSFPSRSSRFWQNILEIVVCIHFFLQASVFTICCQFVETSESGNLTFVCSKLPVGTNSFWNPTCSFKKMFAYGQCAIAIWMLRRRAPERCESSKIEVFLLGKWREVNSYVFLCCLKRPSSRLQQELQDAVKQDKQTCPMLTSKCSGRLPVEVIIYRKEKYRTVLTIQWSFPFFETKHIDVGKNRLRDRRNSQHRSCSGSCHAVQALENIPVRRLVRPRQDDPRWNYSCSYLFTLVFTCVSEIQRRHNILENPRSKSSEREKIDMTESKWGPMSKRCPS